jgi:hypothetical protein
MEPDPSRGVKRPNIGLLNPPYAQSKSDAELHELYFVKEMLDLLDKGGISQNSSVICLGVKTIPKDFLSPAVYFKNSP